MRTLFTKQINHFQNRQIFYLTIINLAFVCRIQDMLEKKKSQKYGF